jgi:WD40 repeat protein
MCSRMRMQVLRAHVLPLTNCAFNKAGDRFITGSYDRTCKVQIVTAAVERLQAGRGGRGHMGTDLTTPIPSDKHHAAALGWSQVWDTYTGEEVFTLEGHKNVVSGVEGGLTWLLVPLVACCMCIATRCPSRLQRACFLSLPAIVCST